MCELQKACEKIKKTKKKKNKSLFVLFCHWPYKTVAQRDTTNKSIINFRWEMVVTLPYIYIAFIIIYPYICNRFVYSLSLLTPVSSLWTFCHVWCVYDAVCVYICPFHPSSYNILFVLMNHPVMCIMLVCIRFFVINFRGRKRHTL